MTEPKDKQTTYRHYQGDYIKLVHQSGSSDPENWYKNVDKEDYIEAVDKDLPRSCFVTLKSNVQEIQEKLRDTSDLNYFSYTQGDFSGDIFHVLFNLTKNTHQTTQRGFSSQAIVFTYPNDEGELCGCALRIYLDTTQIDLDKPETEWPLVYSIATIKNVSHSPQEREVNVFMDERAYVTEDEILTDLAQPYENRAAQQIAQHILSGAENGHSEKQRIIDEVKEDLKENKDFIQDIKRFFQKDYSEICTIYERLHQIKDNANAGSKEEKEATALINHLERRFISTIKEYEGYLEFAKHLALEDPDTLKAYQETCAAEEQKKEMGELISEDDILTKISKAINSQDVFSMLKEVINQTGVHEEKFYELNERIIANQNIDDRDQKLAFLYFLKRQAPDQAQSHKVDEMISQAQTDLNFFKEKTFHKLAQKADMDPIFADAFNKKYHKLRQEITELENETQRFLIYDNRSAEKQRNKKLAFLLHLKRISSVDPEKETLLTRIIEQSRETENYFDDKPLATLAKVTGFSPQRAYAFNTQYELLTTSKKDLKSQVNEKRKEGQNLELARAEKSKELHNTQNTSFLKRNRGWLSFLGLGLLMLVGIGLAATGILAPIGIALTTGAAIAAGAGVGVTTAVVAGVGIRKNQKSYKEKLKEQSEEINNIQSTRDEKDKETVDLEKELTTKEKKLDNLIENEQPSKKTQDFDNEVTAKYDTLNSLKKAKTQLQEVYTIEGNADFDDAVKDQFSTFKTIVEEREEEISEWDQIEASQSQVPEQKQPENGPQDSQEPDEDSDKENHSPSSLKNFK